MEDMNDSPRAVKVEEHSRCVILTYFQGDINAMVDAHFSRALSKVCKAKPPLAKTKKIQKAIKVEDASPCQGSAAGAFPEPQDSAGPSRLLTFAPGDDPPHSSWRSFPTRPGDGAALPSIAYSLSTEGLSLTGQQYATSLLNLLHSDRTEMGPGVASSSKPDLLSSWTLPAGFREPVDPAVGFEPERHLDKKDLYWY